MSDPKSPSNDSFLSQFWALPPDSIPKTIFTAIAVCLVASMIVSSAAVALRPAQTKNALKDKQVNILQVAAIYDPNADVQDAFSVFEAHVVELSSGQISDQYSANEFDDRAAAGNPKTSVALIEDPAGIGRKALYATVYFLRDTQGDIDKVILPIHGYGLWSTLYGYIALEENGNDIFGLQFYDHAETPGLGAEVDNPRWRALWKDAKLRDESGTLQITVSKTVPAAGEAYHIDALAGATLTSVGVDNLIKFWMGEAGFAPFLNNLQSGAIQ